MSEPSEAALAQFIEFTGYPDRAVATIFIKGNDNSWEKAVEAYFTDPNPSRFQNANQSYDESSWSSDRAGETNNTSLVPYQLDDAAQMQIGGSAPSRPPSRISQVGNQGSQGFIGPVYEGEEEAIKRSLEQQETGVIGSGGHEYVPDPPPEKRQRLEASPAFMKPLLRKDFLPSLITILHSIPQCREALLRLGDVLPNYGYNPRWWEGDPVEVAQIIDQADNNSSLDDSEVLYEVQRLMAFLDQTERAYGSVAALASLPALKRVRDEAWETKPIFAQFLEAWEITAGNSMAETEFSRLFSSRVTGPEGQQSWNSDTRWYFRVISDIRPKFEGQDATIYDALDKEFWPSSTTQRDRQDTWLKNVSPVMVFHIQPPMLRQQCKKLNMPLSWDPDMYLLSKQELVREARTQMDECLNFKDQIEDKLFKLRKFSTAQFRHAEGQEFLSAAIKSLNQRHEVNGEQVHDSHIQTTISPKIASRLEMIAEKLSNHIKVLESNLSDLKTRHDQLAKSLAPSISSRESTEGRYKLRGVATSPTARTSITYIKCFDHQSQGAASTPAEEEGQGIEQQQHWWKAKYDFTGGAPLIKQESVPESEVLEAASKEGEEILLVYAVDEFLTIDGLAPLPYSLYTFVEADNQAFRDELDLNPTEIIVGESPEDVEMMPHVNDAILSKPADTSSTTMVDPTQVDTHDVPENLQEIEHIPPFNGSGGEQPNSRGDVDASMDM